MNGARPLGTAEGTHSIEPSEDFLEEYPETQGLLQPYGLRPTQVHVPTGAWYDAEIGHGYYDQRNFVLQAPRHESGPGTLSQQGAFIPIHSLEPPMYEQPYSYPPQPGYYLSGTLAGTSSGPYYNYGCVDGYGHESNVYHVYRNSGRPTGLADRLPSHYQTGQSGSYYPSQSQLSGNARPMTGAEGQQVSALKGPRTNPFTGESQPTFHSAIGQNRATTLTLQPIVDTQGLGDMRLIDYEGRLSDSRYADSYEDDDESGSILMADIPGFPMLPPTIPTPSYNISPPPSVPCPPLPAEYNLASRHLAPAQTSEVGNQRAIPRSTTSNARVQSSPRFLREGEVGFSGLEVATEGIQGPCKSYLT